jgi:hypothetical protein
MSAYELNTIAEFIEQAICPEDIFVGYSKDAFKQSYRNLARILHPDKYTGEDAITVELAKKVFQKLENARKEAELRLENGTWGKRTPFAHKVIVPVVIKGKYILEGILSAGDIADVHFASMESSSKRKNLLLKIARSTNDNDLLRAEEEILGKLHGKLPKDTWGTCIPTITESFLVSDYQKRRVNVMEHFDGFLTGVEIRKRTASADGRTIAWMWKRLLVLLEWTHKIGYVHGAVLPPHVMFYPDNDGQTHRDPRKHSIRLIDWCYAIDKKTRTRLSAWVPEWGDFYAPEIINKKPLGPWTDLYMGAKTMLYLVGGNTNKDIFPDSIPKEISFAIAQCLNTDPNDRPQSIGKYFEFFTEQIRKVYGAPKWHHFIVPGK